MKRFVKRWKYTLTAIFCWIIPSVIALFFPATRPYGTTFLIFFLFFFIIEGLKYL